MAELETSDLHDVQASNLNYIYKQLRINELFDRVARLEEEAGLEPLEGTGGVILTSQPPRPEYLSENETVPELLPVDEEEDEDEEDEEVEDDEQLKLFD